MGAPLARGHRILAAVIAAVLLVAAAIAVDRTRGSGGPRENLVAPAGGAAPAPTEPDDPAPSPSAQVQTSGALAHPDTAAAVGAEKLLEAGLAAAQGPWRDLGTPAWRIREEQPVYVAAVELSPAADRVTADVVIASRLTDDRRELVLRLLPAASALAPANELTVEVSVDGDPVEAEVDNAGARLIVPIGGERTAGTAVAVRVRLSYRLLALDDIVDDGGPAAFGLLAAHPQVTALGHWLPLLTFPSDEGPMISWGDVGGFPTGVWSVRAVHDGVLATGGEDRPCPEQPEERTCTWSRGIALRDDSAVLYPGAPVTASFELAETTYRVLAAEGSTADAEAVLSETVGAADAFVARFGPLAWTEVDAVRVPLGPGAAGMEFPGLILIDDGQWTNVDGGFGTAVIAHEVAHQWFHALVGNGSLSDPVVDESLAEYLTYLYWRDTFGEGAAARWADARMRERYAAGRPTSGPEGPPAQPLDAFEDARTYGRLVYARAPLAWVVAEDRIGVDDVEAFLSGLVSRYGLGVVTDERVLEDAAAFDPRLGEVLQRYWSDPTPLDD